MNGLWNLNPIYTGFEDPAFEQDLQTLKDAQSASAQWIDTEGTADSPEANALRERIGDLFARAEGTMN